MADNDVGLCILRFGIFELQLANRELRKAGALVRVQAPPLTLLILLVERHGQVVTRQEIRGALWGDDVFVDFARGINFCINHLRVALSDDSQSPRYIETVPRRGYRFIAEVSPVLSCNGLTDARKYSDEVAAQPGSNPNRLGLQPPYGRRRLVFRSGPFVSAQSLFGCCSNYGCPQSKAGRPPENLAASRAPHV